MGYKFFIDSLLHLAYPCWPWSTVQTKPHRLTMQPEGGSQQLPDTGQSGGQVITSIKASSSQLSSPQTTTTVYFTGNLQHHTTPPNSLGLHLSHKVKIPNSRGRKQKWTVLKCFTWSQTPWTYYDKQCNKCLYTTEQLQLEWNKLLETWKKNPEKCFPMSSQNYLDADSEFEYLWLLPLKYAIERINNSTVKQLAFAMFLMKNGEYWIFPPFYPDHKNNRKIDNAELTLHSEEIVIRQICHILETYGNKVSKILIYSVKSPCVERSNKECCMLQLKIQSLEWLSKFGIITYVAFGKFWDLENTRIIPKYCDISSPSSVYFPYIKQLEKNLFKLTSYFNCRGIYKQIFSPSIDSKTESKGDLNRYIKSILNQLKELAASPTPYTKLEHLDRGQKLIESCNLEITIQQCLLIKWQEIINENSLPDIIISINIDYMYKIVETFHNHFRFDNINSLKLYYIPELCNKMD